MRLELSTKEASGATRERGAAVEELKFVGDEEDGTFEGYGSIFGEVDRGGDIVVKGAFLDSLTRYPPGKVKMLWQHDPTQVIGKWTEIEEDSRGLRVKGRLFNTPKGIEVKTLLKEDAVDGLSIGYRVLVDEYDRNNDTRLLKSVELREVSVVTFPMNESATVSQVKRGDQMPTERDFESFLRDAGGFSKREAQAIIAKGYRSLCNARDAEAQEMAEAKRALADLAAKLRSK